MFDFKEQLQVGKKGEQLVKLFYDTQQDDGKRKFIVKDARPDEQLKGADLMVISNELGVRYVEVKTDTQAKDTGNVALEIQIVQDNGSKQIGCQFKTFADFMFYWIYPTSELLYWQPEAMIPYIVDWIMEGKYKIIEAENKNFFSRNLIVPIEDLVATGLVKTLNVSYHLLEEVEANLL
tara:strand:- start:22262 stop:22798 length:537 start_codon:yes stop_codon:yes gene_type:complete